MLGNTNALDSKLFCNKDVCIFSELVEVLIIFFFGPLLLDTLFLDDSLMTNELYNSLYSDCNFLLSV